MKYFFLFMMLWSCRVWGQSDIYSIQINTDKGKDINFQDFKGRKVMIAVASPGILQSGKLKILDSLRAANPNVVVMIIPAEDLSERDVASPPISIDSNIYPELIISESAFVKKDSGEKQNKLIKWLTHVSLNLHFDNDVRTEDQLYVISESGILYGVLEKGVPLRVVDAVLKQPDIKQ